MPCNAQNTQIDQFVSPPFWLLGNTNFKGKCGMPMQYGGGTMGPSLWGAICDVFMFPKGNKGTNE